jgi:hypothetical protein
LIVSRGCVKQTAPILASNQKSEMSVKVFGSFWLF